METGLSLFSSAALFTTHPPSLWASTFVTCLGPASSLVSSARRIRSAAYVSSPRQQPHTSRCSPRVRFCRFQVATVELALSSVALCAIADQHVPLPALIPPAHSCSHRGLPPPQAETAHHIRSTHPPRLPNDLHLHCTLFRIPSVSSTERTFRRRPGNDERAAGIGAGDDTECPAKGGGAAEESCRLVNRFIIKVKSRGGRSRAHNVALRRTRSHHILPGVTAPECDPTHGGSEETHRPPVGA